MPGQSAELTGQIAVGDRIMRVNDVDLKGASHEKAIQTLIQAANLSLVLVSDPQPMPQPTNIVTPALPTADQDNTPANSPAPQRKFTQLDLAKRVSVEGYPGLGTLRFVGLHVETNKLRCGIEMDAAVGKNNGTVKVCTSLCVWWLDMNNCTCACCLAELVLTKWSSVVDTAGLDHALCHQGLLRRLTQFYARTALPGCFLRILHLLPVKIVIRATNTSNARISSVCCVHRTRSLFRVLVSRSLQDRR